MRTAPKGNSYAVAGALGSSATTWVDIACSSDNGGNGWGLSGCPSDVNDNGHAASNPIMGTFAATIDNNTGRGPFVNLQFPSDPSGICTGLRGHGYCKYAYYLLEKQQMYVIS